MKILKSVKKIPGGLMVVPLLLGATINTFFPQALEIGGFTSDLFKKGAMPILSVFLFCNGAQINVKQAGDPLLKGVVLTLVKFITGAFIGYAVNKFFGPKGMLGLTPLALIAAITNSNGGLYAALAGEYGDSTDVGAISILSINDGPFFTMLAFGLTGISNIPVIALVATVIPIIIGFVLGNLDEDIRDFLAPGTTLTIPFFAFPLGAALNFGQILEAGPSGVLLGLICTFVSGGMGYLSMKLIKSENPQVGAAIGTSAGNSVATPAALASADPSLQSMAAVATAQVAAAIIVTAIICPLFVNYLDKVNKEKLI